MYMKAFSNLLLIRDEMFLCKLLKSTITKESFIRCPLFHEPFSKEFTEEVNSKSKDPALEQFSVEGFS